MSSEVKVAHIPTCDVCMKEPAKYDAKTTMGPWANLCAGCFGTYGIGLGTGRGQRLVLEEQA